MARDFNGTTQYGTLTLNTAQKAITVSSWAWWEYLDSNAQYKRPYHMVAGAFAWRMEFDDGWGYVFVATQNSADGKWSIAKPTTGAWHHICITYDGSSTTNNPLIYLDGVSQAVTTRSTPSGTLLLPDGTVTIGRATGGGQEFDGRLAEFAMWNRILTAGEVAALGKGFAPPTNPRGLLTYLPLIGRASPEIELMGGSNLTLSNSPVNIAHPRIIYPSGSEIRRFTTAAAGGGSIFTPYRTLMGVGI